MPTSAPLTPVCPLALGATAASARAGNGAPAAAASGGVTPDSLRQPASREGRTSVDRYIWQEQVLTRCRRLRASWALLLQGQQATAALPTAHFLSLVEAAEESCDLPRGWWRHRHSAAVECAWTNAHAAEALLLAVTPAQAVGGQVNRVQDAARTHLPDGSAQRSAVDAVVLPQAAGGAGQAAVDPAGLAAVLSSAHDRSAADHVRVRSFRNMVVAATGVLTLVTALLAFLGYRRPAALPMCTTAAADRSVQCLVGIAPTGSDVLFVALVGAAAGSLSGVLSINRLQGTSTPFAVPLALTVLKVPAGALSAVLGVLLLRAGLDIGITSSGAVLRWAILFGASQQLLTRLADLQGQAVLNVASSQVKKS
jgi:hypothetical protein